jgi:tripartite-type tricarboxylate transporter receptor subunit TctC
MMHAIRLLALRGAPIAFLLHFVIAPALAQSWPTRPLHLIVGQAPGGQSDALARLVAHRFSEILAQPVVVENRGGAGGTLAAEAVARASADGYTLLLAASSSFVFAPAVMKELHYSVRDFVPVGMIARVPYGLAVHPRIPARTIAEFVAFARAHPGQLNYGSSGIASTSNLLFALLQRDASIDVVHIPYKGSAIALNELIAGRIDATFADLAALVPLERGGRLRIIAVVGGPSKAVPDVKTASEQGYANVAMEPWYGIAAPAGTPGTIVAKLAAALRTTLDIPEVRQRFARAGYLPLPTTGEGMAKLIAQQTATFTALVDQAQPAVQ